MIEKHMNPFERMNQVPPMREPEPELEFEPEPELKSEDDEGAYESVAVPYGEPLPPKSTEAPFDQNAAVEKERGFLERVEGKARQVAKVMALVSALSFGSGYAQESYAVESTDDTPKAERIERSHDRTLGKERLTSAGRMFDRIVDDARKDMSKIKTAEDAEWLLRAHFDRFVGEYYTPTRGHVRKTPFGTRVREYSEGDLHSLLENAHDMKDILIQLHETYDIDHTERLRQIDDIIEKVERSSSYAGIVQSALMKQVEKQLGIFKIRIRHR